jgi:prophage tail gpP-like protein
MGRGSRATITVQGWSHAAGLWQPNQLVRVTSALLDVDDDLIVAGVTLTLDEKGTLAELSVCRAEAFDVLAPKAKKQKGLAWQ